MKIGIIGAGNVGGALGTLWAGKGHEVVFGVRDTDGPKLQQLLTSTQGKARAAGVKDAAAFGEIVVFATPWPATQDAIDSAGNLTGKIVIDCTNPLLPDLSGLALGANNSAGEEVGRWANGATVVKAFNTIGAANFGNPRFGSENATMFICGGDASAKASVGRLAAELGFDVVDAGPLSASRLLESLAVLWLHLAFKGGFSPTDHAFKLLRR